MDHRQLRVLVEIRESEVYEYTTDPEWKVNVIHYLAGQDYIYYRTDDLESPRKYCAIKEEGRAAIYEWYRDRINTRLALGIAVFGAIGAYREELASIVQAIGTLWRSITGG